MPQRRGVLNHFLKSFEQKKRDLVKNSMNVLRTRAPTEFNSETKPLPQTLSLSVQPLLEKMDEVKDGISQNQPIISEHLDILNEQQIKALTTIFDPKRRVAYKEERLVDASKIFNSDIEVIEQWQEYLPTLKRDMVELWIKSFASEFGKVDDNTGDITYDISKFNQILSNKKEIIADRMRRQSQRSAGNSSEEPRQRRWFSLFG